MSDEERKDIERRVNAFPFWYHKIELPHGVVTPGWAPLDAASYRLPDDLAGKRVLDVGAWDGYWSFEALRRGARQVVAVDDFSDDMGVLEQGDRHGWETFDLCRSLLGYNDELCQRHDASIYDIDEQRFGRFDVVFFFGTLYHLRYPQLALDKLADVCDGEIFIESAILDDYSPYREGLGGGYPDGHMVMEFYPGTQYGDNASNWWVPTLHCLLHMVGAAGFSAEGRAWKLVAKPESVSQCRGFVHAKKR